MARKVIFKVIKEIVLTKITERPDFIGFNNAYEQLRIIYWNNDSLPQKLNELGNILEQLSSALTFRDSHLKIYIDTIMPWLRGVSEQWIALESSLNELQDTSSTLSEVVILMDMTQTLLSAPALRCILDGAQLDGISQGICGVQQILGQLQLWQALPGDARIGDYLSILSGNPAMGDILGPSVQQLCQALAYALNTTLSPENTLSDQLVWLASLLNNPLMRQYVQPHLEVILGEQQATQLFSIFKFVDKLRCCPMDSSLSEQTGWLLSTMSEHINGGDIPALAWSQQFLAALGTDSNTIKVLNQLLNLRQSSQSWKTLASGIFNVATQQGIGSWALSLAAQRVLPASVAQELETFYRASSRKESVNSMAQRAATSMFNIAKPFVVGALMGNPLAAVTVHYAETLQQCSSVEDMLKWFIAHDQSKNNTLHSVNGHYLNVMMLWQIHQAMNSTDIHETEAALNKLAGQLNKFDVVKHYPQLKKLIDLLPLLPALREASQTISIPLSANSLVDWSDQWLAALANSQSQNLKNLRVQLSLHVENWLADAVISGCEVLVQQPWGMISGANAAPADRSVPITTPNSLAPPEHNWETEINWSFMAPAIGLETIGLAAIGYALWKWRQPTLVKETVRRNPNSNSVYHTAQTVPLIQGISPERPGCASLWDQKVPLLLGIAAMAAGGGVMAYGGFNRLEKQVAASSKITEEEYKQELAIIQELDVPPLDFLTTDLEVAEPDFFSEMNSEVFIRSKKDTSFQRQRTPIGDIPSQISSIQEKVSDPLLKAEFIAYPNTRERGT